MKESPTHRSPNRGFPPLQETLLATFAFWAIAFIAMPLVMLIPIGRGVVPGMILLALSAWIIGASNFRLNQGAPITLMVLGQFTWIASGRIGWGSAVPIGLVVFFAVFFLAFIWARPRKTLD